MQWINQQLLFYDCPQTPRPSHQIFFLNWNKQSIMSTAKQFQSNLCEPKREDNYTHRSDVSEEKLATNNIKTEVDESKSKKRKSGSPSRSRSRHREEDELDPQSMDESESDNLPIVRAMDSFSDASVDSEEQICSRLEFIEGKWFDISVNLLYHQSTPVQCKQKMLPRDFCHGCRKPCMEYYNQVMRCVICDKTYHFPWFTMKPSTIEVNGNTLNAWCHICDLKKQYPYCKVDKTKINEEYFRRETRSACGVYYKEIIDIVYSFIIYHPQKLDCSFNAGYVPMFYCSPSIVALKNFRTGEYTLRFVQQLYAFKSLLAVIPNSGYCPHMFHKHAVYPSKTSALRLSSQRSIQTNAIHVVQLNHINAGGAIIPNFRLFHKTTNYFKSLVNFNKVLCGIIGTKPKQAKKNILRHWPEANVEVSLYRSGKIRKIGIWMKRRLFYKKTKRLIKLHRNWDSSFGKSVFQETKNIFKTFNSIREAFRMAPKSYISYLLQIYFPNQTNEKTLDVHRDVAKFGLESAFDILYLGSVDESLINFSFRFRSLNVEIQKAVFMGIMIMNRGLLASYMSHYLPKIEQSGAIAISVMGRMDNT